MLAHICSLHITSHARIRQQPLLGIIHNAMARTTPSLHRRYASTPHALLRTKPYDAATRNGTPSATNAQRHAGMYEGHTLHNRHGCWLGHWPSSQNKYMLQGHARSLGCGRRRAAGMVPGANWSSSSHAARIHGSRRRHGENSRWRRLPAIRQQESINGWYTKRAVSYRPYQTNRRCQAAHVFLQKDIHTYNGPPPPSSLSQACSMAYMSSPYRGCIA